ncbi:auxin-responsive protein IAA31-like [Arachis stenosperma]|uniref:auxin-responsive protein IAA31-like n=1 Tax=Arachis stenosperma TaxID=217475 RepID=UPI0025AD82AB|nr:auxin-responsive protein IAA31-like [Arachis stenosperma]
MGKRGSSCSSSSSSFSTASSHLHDDLSLGLSISSTHHQHLPSSISRGQWQIQSSSLASTSQGAELANDCSDHSTFFVKVYMEGIPIGRKLNLLVHDGYYELVKALEQMFDTTILWGTELDAVQAERCHVLTYEDGEGDLIMVGDVPWEMFLSAVKRLKITRVDTFGC